MFLKRSLSLDKKRSTLLLGPRRVGKSTYLKHSFKDAECEWVDLLKSDLYFEYRAHSALLRERFQQSKKLIVIDEIQFIPDLMREVHWLIENSSCRFVLSGSSARQLRKQGVTNLAGRLRTVHLYPLTCAEIPNFRLDERLQYGCLPPLISSDEPELDLKDYCGEYLKEEVQAEGLVRNLPSFAKFLELSALSNAELLAYSSIARDCGVAQKTIREYFQILEDTLLAYQLEAFTQTKKRRSILAPKFYYFDCGIPNSLLGRKISPKTPEYGKSFEQFLILEVIAARSYFRAFEKIWFWRSASGYEVDLIIDGHTACEFKSGIVHSRDVHGLMAIREEISLKNTWVVSRDTHLRKLENGIVVVPWREFLKKISEGDFSPF